MILFSRMENRSDDCPAPHRKSNNIVTSAEFARSDSLAARMLGLRLAQKALCAHISLGHRPRNLNRTDNEALKARFNAIHTGGCRVQCPQRISF
jgi:hypothetical protein